MLKVIFSQSRRYPQAGKIHSITAFPSTFVKTRQVDVWLPNNYKPAERYAVLYMHDGQNLFDTESGFAGMTWAVDFAIQQLINANKIRKTIVVGVWNTPARFREYLPAAAYTNLPDTLKKTLGNKKSVSPLSDAYLQFLVEELKPYIDANYPVFTDPANTFVMGSSMGGLISAYALAKYPEVFGGAGCLSTHWPLAQETNSTDYSRPFMEWLRQNLPRDNHHRVYFDYGTETLDKQYEIHQKKMDEIMREIGYIEGQNWITYKDKGGRHDENSWRKRLAIPLEFLLQR
jgi:predicted alpha/beta superfamily hydrolase